MAGRAYWKGYLKLSLVSCPVKLFSATSSTAGKIYSGKFLVRIPPALHQKAALQAAARGESLNQFVAEALSGA